VFEPTLLAFVAGRHVALEPFGGRVVVVGRQHGLRKRITVLDDRRDALVDEPAFVMAQDPLTVEAEVPFRRGVDPGDVEVLVEDEDGDLYAVEDVVDEGFGGGRPVRGRRIGGCRWPPPDAGVRP